MAWLAWCSRAAAMLNKGTNMRDLTEEELNVIGGGDGNPNVALAAAGVGAGGGFMLGAGIGAIVAGPIGAAVGGAIGAGIGYAGIFTLASSNASGA